LVSEYLYFSSFLDTAMRHFQQLAERILKSLDLKATSLVL